MDIIDLSGLMNPNGKILPEDDITTVRERVISRTTTEDGPMFLVATKNGIPLFGKLPTLNIIKKQHKTFLSVQLHGRIMSLKNKNQNYS